MDALNLYRYEQVFVSDMTDTDNKQQDLLAGQDSLKQMGISPKVVEVVLPVSENSGVGYPALFTGLPIFKPTNDRSKGDTKGVIGERFTTVWGSIERHGPGVNIFDQDTLIAIIKLGQRKKHVGPKSLLLGSDWTGPVIIDNETKDLNIESHEDEESVAIHIGECSARHINKYLGRDLSDKNLQETRDSIKRLALQNMFFYTNKLDDYRISEKEKVVEFFRYEADRDLKGMINFVFPPLMVHLLQDYATIRMDQRKPLSAVGKSVQLLLIGMPKSGSIPFDELMMAIGATKLTEFKRALNGRPGRKGQLEIMKEVGFLADFNIEGTGKAEPYVLEYVKN